MTNRFRWAAVLFVTAMPGLTAHAQVYYSPVFNMPLQPAPSPSNGGFYWVTPDGRVFGPNYSLYPPFTPMSGFDNTFIGQRIFAKIHEEAIASAIGKGGPGKGQGQGQGQGGGAPPPTKQV